MPARTPVPVRVVAVSARAIRGGGRGRADKDIPSRELVAIQQLTREVAVLRGEVIEDAPAEDRLKAWTWRHRKPLAALYVGVALAGAKVLMLGPSFLPAIGLAVVVVLAVAAVVWVRRCGTTAPKVLLEQIPPEYRWRVAPLLTPRAAAVAGAACAAVWWVRPVTLKEASWTWTVAVLVAVVARAYRFRIRPAAPAAEPTVGHAERWELYVAPNEKAAEGSRAVGVHQVVSPNGDRIGFALDVALPEGSKGATATAASLRGRIATTYRVGVQDVMLEPNRRDDTQLAVTVLDVPGANALDHTHLFDGTGLQDDGDSIRWTQAIRADWAPGVIELAHRQQGARHGHVSGETGGGKSETMETILRSVTTGGLVVPVIIDIGGATFHDWADRVPVFITETDDALRLLANVVGLHEHRKSKLRLMRQTGRDGEDLGPRRVYPVDREYPHVLVVFDEWQFALSDPTRGAGILRLTEDIVTQTRKTMISMLLAGQSTGLVHGFKNSQIVRTQCQAGYMIAHRNNTESGSQVFGKSIQVDPSTIPSDVKGACYLTSNVDARDSMARSVWTKTPALFDQFIDIPNLPADELGILRYGLTGALAPGELNPLLEASRVAVIEPAVTVGRPNLTVVPTAPSDSLKVAMKAWAREQGRPVRRVEFVDEFAKRRVVASRYKVDKALAEMKDDGEMDADADGYYTLKEAA
jgi:hypothetical protein